MSGATAVLLLTAPSGGPAEGSALLRFRPSLWDMAAVALYERMGFDRHERRGPGTDSYYFEIDLPRAGYVNPDATAPRPEE